ncbi:AraC-type DNA-binding protein [Sphingomonas guangdongensis]|uniref:AraC-type DNA-binding protein n=1 Tax=Sphingomonas guangdongensis TaxID=1141890 RepID=A0A285QZQ1_9SPHN|nr:AraC family transcriptional regulator [Sphingomonas guangdongensis]SOB87375.1 AraC-type DNA-binding protein [Sphingomonas guangdongensis]
MRPQTPPALMGAVTELIESRGGGQGRFETGMPGVHLVQSFHTFLPVPNMYRPSLCVVFKGAKEILFGDTTLHYREMECLVVSVEIPASGRMVGATEANPYLGMTIEFDTAALREVLQQLPRHPAPLHQSSACVFVGKVDGALSDCLTRMIRLMSNAPAIPVLYPTLMRELYYWLLSGPYGGEIAKLALPESHAERIARALNHIREHYAAPLRVEQLAEVAGMSTSSFHHHFKIMTSMTPVQYQKQLRLLEARRLMLSDASNVSEAAYQVGYESASQFSREYTRSFGVAPKRDVLNYKALLAQAEPR